jgi:hypothetical protein
MGKDSDLDREYPLLRAEAVLRITDALERMLIRKRCLIETSENETTILQYANKKFEVISHGGKLTALWDAWKELNKEQK